MARKREQGKPSLDSAGVTFHIVPHGIQADFEIHLTEGEPILQSGCRDFGGDDGSAFLRLLIAVATYATRADLDKARIAFLKCVPTRFLDEDDRLEARGSSVDLDGILCGACLVGTCSDCTHRNGRPCGCSSRYHVRNG